MTHSVSGCLTARRSCPHGSISARRVAIRSAELIFTLYSDDRQTIGKDIQKVEFGWPIGRPHCAPGHGLWEVRSDLANNRFCMGEGYMILLHGFIKRTQKAPRQHIDLALMRNER